MDSVWVDNYPRLLDAHERRVERWGSAEFKERANLFSVNTKTFSTIQFRNDDLYLLVPDYPLYLVAYKINLSNLSQKIWGTDTIRIADSAVDLLSVTSWSFRFKETYLAAKECWIVR